MVCGHSANRGKIQPLRSQRVCCTALPGSPGGRGKEGAGMESNYDTLGMAPCELTEKKPHPQRERVSQVKADRPST